MAIVEESALGEHGPLGRTGTPFLRRYDDDAICCVGTVQGRCRRPLHDLDVLNRLRVDVADSTEIAPAVPERSRTVVRRHAYAIDDVDRDRKSTRLNSSHSSISYAVFCLKKKKTTI